MVVYLIYLFKGLQMEPLKLRQTPAQEYDNSLGNKAVLIYIVGLRNTLFLTAEDSKWKGCWMYARLFVVIVKEK